MNITDADLALAILQCRRARHYAALQYDIDLIEFDNARRAIRLYGDSQRLAAHRWYRDYSTRKALANPLTRGAMRRYRLEEFGDALRGIGDALRRI